MDDLEKRTLYNRSGIDETIDLSDIIDGEIRPLDISELQKNRPAKAKAKKKKDKNQNFSSILFNSLEKVSELCEKIKNSKNPEILIIINIIFGVFFHLLSDPPLLLSQTSFFFIDEIIGFLKNSIFFIFLTALFFSFAYLQIFFIRKDISKYLLILPLIIQLFLFLFSDNEINNKINFGIYRKFVLFTSTILLFFLGLFLKYLKDFLQRKSLKIKITVFIFYFTLFIYLNILIKGTCEKDRIYWDENGIDNSIGCNTEDYGDRSCFTRIMDDLFDFGNFFSKENLMKNDHSINLIYLNKIKEAPQENMNNNDDLEYMVRDSNNNVVNGEKGDLKESSGDFKHYGKYTGKKIYAFPDIKTLFFEKFIKSEGTKFDGNEGNLGLNNSTKSNNQSIEAGRFDSINPHDFVDVFIDNIVNIDTGIHIEISINSSQNSNENKGFLSTNNLEVKNPINANSNTNSIITQKAKEEKEESLTKQTTNSTVFVNDDNNQANKINSGSNQSNNSLKYLDNSLSENSNKTMNNTEKNNNSINEKTEPSKDKTQDKSELESIQNHEILYDNRDLSKPFININPQPSEKMKAKLIKTDPKETPNTIVLLNFENLQRTKFKTKFAFTYNFIKRFYKASAKKMNLDLMNNLSEQEKINFQSQLNQNLQAFQHLKFYPKSENFSLEKNFPKKLQSLLAKMDSLGFLTMFGATDLSMSEIQFNSTSNTFDRFDQRISKGFYHIINSYDKVILQKLYSKFESLIIKKSEDEKKILSSSNNNLILDYAAKFISQFGSTNKLIHLKFDQTSYTKDLDKELFLWFKNLRKTLENKKFILIAFSSIAEEKPFFVSEFSDIYSEDIERRATMLFNVFPTNKFDPKFIEMVKINENFPTCECDFFEMIDYIVSGKEAKINEKYVKYKELISEKKEHVNSEVLCKDYIQSKEFCEC